MPEPELASVASDPLGVSGRVMLEALVAGTHDPRCWPSWLGTAAGQAAGVAGGLGGPLWGPSWVVGRRDVGRIDQLDETIARLSAEVARVAAPFSPLLALLMTIPG
jgi:transposase